MVDKQRGAVGLAKLGFTLVKLKANSKQPAGGRGWQQRATSDKGQIRRWRGDYNVGVLGGTLLANDRRLLIVDVDDKNGKHGSESLDRLQKDLGSLPRTASCYTATGGRHLYLTVPKQLPLVGISQRLAKSYTGIDLLGAGLLAVAPPSTVVGGSYEWDVYPSEGLSEAPSWLLDRLKPEGRGASFEPEKSQRKNSERPLKVFSGSELVQEMVSRFAIVHPGQRNDRMHRAVASLFAKNLSQEKVRDTMIIWHRHFAEQMDTPLAIAEKLLDQCIASTLKRIASGAFVPFGTTNHTKACALTSLGSEQIDCLNKALPLPLCPTVTDPSVADSSPLTNKDVQDRRATHLMTPRGEQRTLSRQESAFIAAFTLHSLYEVAKGQGACPSSVPATRNQLVALMDEKFGVAIGNRGPQFPRLRNKFVTKGSHKASLYELVENVHEGSRRIPSRYRWMLPAEVVGNLFGTQPSGVNDEEEAVRNCE